MERDKRGKRVVQRARMKRHRGREEAGTAERGDSQEGGIVRLVFTDLNNS